MLAELPAGKVGPHALAVAVVTTIAGARLLLRMLGPAGQGCSMAMLGC